MTTVDFYDKEQVDDLLVDKADADDVYDKDAIDALDIGTPDDAESTSGSLWARIKNAVARIVSLETADTNNVKKTGTSTVTGTLEVPTTPPTPTSAINSVYANDATEGVNNIMHKSGNETVPGVKTFSNYQNGVMRKVFNVAPPSNAEISATPCKRIMKITAPDYFKIKIDALAILGGFMVRWGYNGNDIPSGGMIKAWGNYRLYYVEDNNSDKYLIVQFPSGFARNQLAIDYVIDGQTPFANANTITTIEDATPEAVPTVGVTYTRVIEIGVLA